MNGSLGVWLNEHFVGRLEETAGGLAFVYDEAYAITPDAEPLSYVLPIRKELYSGSEVESYFSNLLPDDYVRTRLGEILQIPRENTFALLEAIGGDCAGAVAIYPMGQGPAAASPAFRRLEDEEAVRILASLEKRPLNVGEEGFRISGAGAQDKLMVCIRDGHVWLPLRGTPSTHIIKPDIRNYPGSVLNEWFCMKLASACGHDTAACDLLYLGDECYYVTVRYDRVFDNGLAKRLHQEDFCQLLKIDPRHKYEVLGGPGILNSLELLRALELSAAETVAFLSRIVFNFLVGNGDAHGKNFSVVYHGRRCALAPMYDIMSTTIYPEVGKRMAMKIDGEYAFKWITMGKFIRMGENAGLGKNIMENIIHRQVTQIRKHAELLLQKAETIHPSGIYRQIVNGILNRCNQLEPR